MKESIRHDGREISLLQAEVMNYRVFSIRAAHMRAIEFAHSMLLAGDAPRQQPAHRVVPHYAGECSYDNAQQFRHAA